MERSIEQVLKFRFEDLKSYISQQNYVLIKLHGSVNWGYEVENFPSEQASPQALIAAAPNLKISERIRIVPNSPMSREGDGTVVFSALSIPVANKDKFSCPRDHIQQLEKMLPLVKKILVIGWR